MGPLQSPNFLYPLTPFPNTPVLGIPTPLLIPSIHSPNSLPPSPRPLLPCPFLSHPILSLFYPASQSKLIQAISIAPLQVRSTTQKPSRHSTDTVPEFHAEAPQATAS